MIVSDKKLEKYSNAKMTTIMLKILTVGRLIN